LASKGVKDDQRETKQEIILVHPTTRS